MIRFFPTSVYLIFALISTIACSNTQSKEEMAGTDLKSSSTRSTDSLGANSQSVPSLFHDTTIVYKFNNNPIEVIIKFPSKTAFKGTIVALPGWNFDNKQWCDSTDLCNKALAKGYAIILPEMGKSIYCDSIFPETRKDWLKYPTRSWMKETMIPTIQRSFNLLVEDQSNFVMGLSTGARGAVLLALDLPEIFSACGALSGDFDQTRYTKDKLYNGYYGSFEANKQRWLNNDNAITSIQQLTVPIYIAHGQKDKIVPIDYSQQLFIALQEAGNEESILNVNPTAGHTYTFWNSEVDAVLTFFEKNSGK